MQTRNRGRSFRGRNREGQELQVSLLFVWTKLMCQIWRDVTSCRNVLLPGTELPVCLPPSHEIHQRCIEKCSALLTFCFLQSTPSAPITQQQ